MEGQAVSIGSSISTTGSMLVYCNKPYVLKVDDVVWSPIGTRDGADEFVLSTGGLVTVYVDDERVFFFRNQIVQDFSVDRVATRFYNGSEIIGNVVTDNNVYAQRVIPTNADTIDIVLRGSVNGNSLTGAQLREFGVTSSQGEVNVTTASAEYLQFRIGNLDPSSYCLVRVGNVLVGFYLPS